MKKALLLIVFTNMLFANTITLTSGNPHSAYIAKDAKAYYKILVTQGQSVTPLLNGLNADADLYVRIGEKPTTDIFDCKSEESDLSDESCTIPPLANDTDVYILVNGFEAANYTLTATLNEGDVTILASGTKVSSSVANKEMKYYKIVAHQGDSINSLLNGLNADADLYVRLGEKPTTDIFDCKSEESDLSDESCTIPAVTNDTDVYILVYGYEAATYAITSTVTNTNSHLIFKTDFDDGTSLSAIKPDGENSWTQDIINHPYSDFKAFFHMITSSKDPSKSIENKIETTSDVNGNDTQALHQIIKTRDLGWTQDAYTLETGDKEQKQLYIRYSIKLPNNLSTILGKENGWLALSEFKTTADYRLALYIYTDKTTGTPYWYAHGDNDILDNIVYPGEKTKKNGIPYVQFWERNDTNIPVLEDEWMDIEIFWNRSKNSNEGRVWLTIDGKTAIDYYGKTKKADPIHEIMLFTNYANVPLDQWIDNVEVWDNFPCGQGKSCH